MIPAHHESPGHGLLSGRGDPEVEHAVILRWQVLQVPVLVQLTLIHDDRGCLFD
jgi:hypothetical protein